MRDHREDRDRSRCDWLGGVSLLALTASTFLAAGANAAEFSAGGLSGSFDTTITTGALFRVQERDPDLIGRDNPGGRAATSNGDNGNLNYDTGLASLAARATHELKLDYQNYGAFLRASYFYDVINAQETSELGARTNRFPLSDEAIEAVGRDFNLLDAYVYGNWDVSDRPVTARLGNHVVNWGESTFIPGGLSSINPFDVAALRTPGAELRDALLPVPMVSVNAGVTDNLSAEAFYQFAWKETQLDPAGTLFSTNDYATPGGTHIELDPRTAAIFGARIPRAPDDEPGSQGQFGVAARYYAEELNATEFGAYFVNLHSRVPLVDAVTGTTAGLMSGDYAGSARYRVAYPDDIRVLGASFNTNVGSVSLQGEYTLRMNQPLQVNGVDLLQAVFAPGAVVGACSGPAQGAGGPTALARCQGTLSAFNANRVLRDVGQTYAMDPATAVAQAMPRFNQPLLGYREHEVSQAQMTVTNVFPPALGADQWVFVGEVGGAYVHGMPDSAVLRYDGLDAPDAFSWGYRMRLRAEFFNAIAGFVNLAPTLAWSHDVSGTTPLPLATFLEDRKSVSLGLQASWYQSWVAEAQYTSYFGAGDRNTVHDRDFVSVTLKHFF